MKKMRDITISVTRVYRVPEGVPDAEVFRIIADGEEHMAFHGGHDFDWADGELGKVTCRLVRTSADGQTTSEWAADKRIKS